MTIEGYIKTERCTFNLDAAGRLILTHADGTEEVYNEGPYDDSDECRGVIRFMLASDGVRNLTEA